jgi:hypothetical protein
LTPYCLTPFTGNTLRPEAVAIAARLQLGTTKSANSMLHGYICKPMKKHGNQRHVRSCSSNLWFDPNGEANGEKAGIAPSRS